MSNTNPPPNWPFPPASGPKPWTPAQKAELLRLCAEAEAQESA